MGRGSQCSYLLVRVSWLSVLYVGTAYATPHTFVPCHTGDSTQWKELCGNTTDIYTKIAPGSHAVTICFLLMPHSFIPSNSAHTPFQPVFFRYWLAVIFCVMVLFAIFPHLSWSCGGWYPLLLPPCAQEEENQQYWESAAYGVSLIKIDASVRH